MEMYCTSFWVLERLCGTLPYKKLVIANRRFGSKDNTQSGGFSNTLHCLFRDLVEIVQGLDLVFSESGVGQKCSSFVWHGREFQLIKFGTKGLIEYVFVLSV